MSKLQFSYNIVVHADVLNMWHMQIMHFSMS